MDEQKKAAIVMPVIKILNVLLMTITFSACWFFYYEPRTLTANSRQVSLLMLLLFILLDYYLARKMDGYLVSYSRIRDLISSNIIAVGVSDAFCYIVIWMLSIHRPKFFPGLIIFVIQCGLLLVWAYVSHQCFFKTHKPQDTIIVYDAVEDMDMVIREYGMEKRYHVIDTKHISEVTNNPQQLGSARTIFLCGVRSSERNPILKYCSSTSKSVFIIPVIGDVILSGAQRMHMFHLPMLCSTRYNPPLEFRILKRLMDIVLSGVALIILSPLILIIALCVKSDGGPAFYKQKRLTKDGKVFEILKFRSMIVDAEKSTGAVLSAGENDPRITKIGRIIRQFRLDELPQLWNIFVGDMSIVGPRPERPEIAAEIEKGLPEFSLRLQAKAGLTGYAQVYGKYNTTPYNKLLMDLMYIASPSILEDLCIMIATVKILFQKESTEGVANGQTFLKEDE